MRRYDVCWYGDKFLPEEADEIIRRDWHYSAGSIDIDSVDDPEFGGGLFYPTALEVFGENHYRMEGEYETPKGLFKAEIECYGDTWTLDIHERIG